MSLRKASWVLARHEGTHVVSLWWQFWSTLRKFTAALPSLVKVLNRLAMRTLVAGVVRTSPVCRFS